MQFSPATRFGARALLALCLVQTFSLAIGAAPAHADDDCVDRFDHDACATVDDAGSAPPATLPGSSVGNPVSLLTGNKHQRETDHAVSGSRLAYVRHYNSARRDADLGLGHGWSDTYATRLFAGVDGSREIVQSNGRRIRFAAVEPNTESADIGIDGSTGAETGVQTGDLANTGPDARTEDDGDNRVREEASRWRAHRPSDGTVVGDANGTYRWQLSDGRTLHFRGSFLIRIGWLGGDFLTLRYRQRRVDTVSDAFGRTLRFEYTPDRPALPRYDERNRLALPGHLAALVRPDGTRIAYAYDRDGNLVEARHPDGTARTYHYEDATWPNHLTGITDRRGVRTNTWRYGPFGKAVSSALAGGRESLVIEHDEPDPVDGVGTTKVTTADGARSLWRWREREATGATELLSGEGERCPSCPPTGEHHAYDEHGLLASTIDARGAGALFHRDESGRLVEHRRRFADGSETFVEVRELDEDTDRLAVVRNPSVRPGHEREIRYRRGPDGLVTEVVERGFSPVVGRTVSWKSESETGIDDAVDSWTPIERVTRVERANGRVVAIDGPRDDVEDVWRFERDTRGELVAIARPDGRQVTIEARDAIGRVKRFRIGTEPSVTLGHDGDGRVTRIAQRGLFFGIERGAEGRVNALIGPWGRWQTFEHDDAGALVAFGDDTGRRVEQRRDIDGRLVARDLFGADGTFVASVALYHDLAGNIDAVATSMAGTDGVPPRERRAGFERDAFGTLLALVGDGGERTSVLHDVRERRTGVTLADGSRREAVVDATGRIAYHVDANGNVTRLWRDDFGRLVARHHPDTGTVRFEHDDGERWIARIAADGQRTERAFDAAGRLIEERLPDDTLLFAYHPSSGALTMAASDAATERFAYSPAGDLIRHERRIDERTFVTTFTHDEHGRLTGRTLPGGLTLRYHYHASGPNIGHLRAITRSILFGLHQETLVAEIDLDPRDGSTGHLSGNGLRTTHRFAPNGELLAIDVDEAMALRYRYDAAGDIVGIDARNTLSSFHHADGRLALAEVAGRRFRYAWDATGNRTARAERAPDGSSRGERFAYPEPGDGNRLQGVTRTRGGVTGEDPSGEPTWRTVESDLNGRPAVTADGRRLHWSARGRLARISEDGRTVAEYAYNGFGERIRKVAHDAAGTRVTYFLYDGHSLSAEIDAERDAIRHYVRLYGRPVALIDGRATHALHGDHLGTVRLATDESGKVSWRAEYDPFGTARIAVERIRLPLRLPGQYADAESALHYNLHRYYDPGVGRYLSPDPTGLAGGENAFAYADGSPLSGSDPLGLAPPGGPLRPDAAYPAKPVADQSFGERLQATLGMVLEHGNLPGQVTDAIAEQITPETIGTTVAVVGLFVALQATPLGWFADAILVGAAWFEFGSVALDLVVGLIDLVRSVSEAGSRVALCAAADRLSGRIATIVTDLSGDIALFGAAGAADGARMIRRLFSSNRDDALTAQPRPCRKAGDGEGGCDLDSTPDADLDPLVALDRQLDASWAALTLDGTKGHNNRATSAGYAMRPDGTLISTPQPRQNLGTTWSRAARNGAGSVHRLDGSDSFAIDNTDKYIEMVRNSYRSSEPPAMLHPRTEKLIREYVDSRKTFEGKDGLPGYHAEVRALNDIFIADPDTTLDSITIGTKALREGTNAPDFPACGNCSGIIPAEVNIYTSRSQKVDNLNETRER